MEEGRGWGDEYYRSINNNKPTFLQEVRLQTAFPRLITAFLRCSTDTKKKSPASRGCGLPQGGVAFLKGEWEQ